MPPLLTSSWPLIIRFYAWRKKKNLSKSTKSDLYLSGASILKWSQNYKESSLSGVFLLSVPLHCRSEWGKDIKTITDQKPRCASRQPNIAISATASHFAVEQGHDAKLHFSDYFATITHIDHSSARCKVVGRGSALTADPNTCFSCCPRWDEPCVVCPASQPNITIVPRRKALRRPQLRKVPVLRDTTALSVMAASPHWWWSVQAAVAGKCAAVALSSKSNVHVKPRLSKVSCCNHLIFVFLLTEKWFKDLDENMFQWGLHQYHSFPRPEVQVLTLNQNLSSFNFCPTQIRNLLTTT